MTETIKTLINNKWEINLLPFRAEALHWTFWEKERLQAMHCVIRDGDVLIDVGAEQGDLTTLFATWGADVIAIEPSAKFIPNISKTFKANNVEPMVIINCLADKETSENFDLQAEVDKANKLADGEPNIGAGFVHLSENPDVSHMAIDELKIEVNVITIDVEGSEYEVLQGAEKTLLRDKPIVFVSIHPEFMWTAHHHSPDDLITMMKKWGYREYYLAFDHEQHYMFKYEDYK